LLSIQPKHARKILLGKKKVELRRVRPAVGRGDEVVVYETSPTCAVVCTVVVDEVLVDAPARLWARIGSLSGVDRAEFMDYYGDLERGYAIRMHRVEPLGSPVSLETLRKAVPGFSPPQSYHYLRPDRPRDQRLAACF
jgi:predicted transcriptional regulator